VLQVCPASSDGAQNWTALHALLPMTRHLARFTNFHRAVQFALPQRNAILTILALTLFMATVNAAEPLALKYIIDSVWNRDFRAPV
jgi:ABC-type bacteriocin/lantibiotic exporter with double-glycine peptidase domain